MTKENFIDWLRKEIQNRNWSQAEFARQSKLSPAQITRLLNGERGVGESALNAIARAFKLPADLVFEKAGKLPAKSDLSPKKREFLHMLEQVDDATAQIGIDVLKATWERKKSETPVDGVRKKKS